MTLLKNDEDLLQEEKENLEDVCDCEEENTCCDAEDTKNSEETADDTPRDLFGNAIGQSNNNLDDVPRDLFGNPINPPKQKPDLKNPKDSKNSSPAAKDKPIGKPMIVRLYGQNIFIEDGTLTLEDIRQKLAKDFPELSKDRTEMVLDEKQGLIIPVIKAARKGNLGLRGEITYNQLIDVIMTGKGDIKPVNDMIHNGYKYEVRKNEIGIFIAPLNKTVGGSFFVPFLPRMPLDVLVPAVKLFYENAVEGLEAAAQIFWNREKKEYFCHIPSQVPRKYHVDITRSTELEMKHLLVMDIHSHHSMTPKFSSIDDADELESRLYAVVGWIPETPGMSVRASCSGKFIPLDPRFIFKWEGQFPFEVVES